MAQATISQFRHLIRTLNYVVSTHAAEELEDNHLSILDLENIVLTGTVTERQRDAQTREVKCVVYGITLDGESAEAVVKVGGLQVRETRVDDWVSHRPDRVEPRAIKPAVLDATACGVEGAIAGAAGAANGRPLCLR